MAGAEHRRMEEERPADVTLGLKDCEGTIAAVATALGGAVAIVRLSGPRALAVAERAWRGAARVSLLTAGSMRLGKVVAADGGVVDQALNVKEAHDIAESLEQTIDDRLTCPVNITIHVEPDLPEQRLSSVAD